MCGGRLIIDMRQAGPSQSTLTTDLTDSDFEDENEYDYKQYVHHTERGDPNGIVRNDDVHTQWHVIPSVQWRSTIQAQRSCVPLANKRTKRPASGYSER
jgi:glucose-6-phosphate 1-dehydrogenase